MSFLIDDKLPPDNLLDVDEVEADKNDGLEGVEGLFEEPEALVEIAVGKTHDGESLPAKPNFVKPVPLSILRNNCVIQRYTC